MVRFSSVVSFGTLSIKDLSNWKVLRSYPVAQSWNNHVEIRRFERCNTGEESLERERPHLVTGDRANSIGLQASSLNGSLKGPKLNFLKALSFVGQLMENFLDFDLSGGYREVSVITQTKITICSLTLFNKS